MSQILFPGRVAYQAELTNKCMSRMMRHAFMVLPPQRRTISISFNRKYFISTPYMVYSIKYKITGNGYECNYLSVLGSDEPIKSFRNKVALMPFYNIINKNVCLFEDSNIIVKSENLKNLVNKIIDLYWSNEFSTSIMRKYVICEEKFINDILELDQKENVKWFYDNVEELKSFLLFPSKEYKQIGSIPIERH